MHVLTIAAHPDDEVLGCGGTMARHVADGDAVTILILGEGLTSRADTRAQAADAGFDALQDDARAAAAVLGVQDVRLLDLPDNRFDSLDLLDVVKRIEEVKASVRPDLVYVHHWGDLNVDHRVTFDATMAAFRPLPGERLATIYAFEIASSTAWAGPAADRTFVPVHYVGIARFLEAKIAAMESYRSERRECPHPRSPASLRALAAYRGAQAGLAAAEAFTTVRTVRAEEPR